MTRLEEHDLKMARDKAENRQARIDLLLNLINKNLKPTQAIDIIAEYREKARNL